MKFRVWDQYGREVRTGVYLCDGVVYRDADSRGVDMSGKRQIYGTPWSYELYSGMLDVDGVDMCAGDIIECFECDHNGIVQKFDYAVVGFEDGCFWYYPKGNMTQPHQLLMHACKPKVIGNTHNPPKNIK